MSTKLVKVAIWKLLLTDGLKPLIKASEMVPPAVNSPETSRRSKALVAVPPISTYQSEPLPNPTSPVMVIVPAEVPVARVPSIAALPKTMPVPERICEAPRVHATAETSSVVEAPTMICEELATAFAAPSLSVPLWIFVAPV